MGEKIEDLGELTLAEKRFGVDANFGLPGRGGRDIHIQNDQFRFQMYDGKYMEFLAKVISSSAYSLSYKKTTKNSLGGMRFWKGD